MTTKLANLFSCLLLENDIITSEEVSIYSYLFEYIIENVIYFTITIIIGILRGNIWYGIVMYLVNSLFRSYGGGAHASTKELCVVISYGIVFFIVFFVPFVAERLGCVRGILYAISGAIIFLISPVDCCNKRLDKLKKRNLKVKCQISIIVISIVFMIMNLFDMKDFCAIIAVTTFVNGIGEIIGVLADR